LPIGPAHARLFALRIQSNIRSYVGELREPSHRAVSAVFEATGSLCSEDPLGEKLHAILLIALGLVCTVLCAFVPEHAFPRPAALTRGVHGS
jgi:hypothetical protein